MILNFHIKELLICRYQFYPQDIIGMLCGEIKTIVMATMIHSKRTRYLITCMTMTFYNYLSKVSDTYEMDLHTLIQKNS